MESTATTAAATPTTANNFLNTEENPKIKSSEKKAIVKLSEKKVKRNLDSDIEDTSQILTCENSNKILVKNLKMFESHFSDDAISLRTKNCSTYLSKFVEIFPENLPRTKIENSNLPSITFVHKIASMQDLIAFESKKKL